MTVPGGPSAEVEALAADLDVVLFGSRAPRAATRRVDVALVEGLGGVQWMLDTCPADDDSSPTRVEIARAAYDLVVDVRHGRMPRPFARLAAAAIFVHVGAATAMHPGAEPLLRVLAALAALAPAVDEGPSLDPTPDRDCAIERAIDRALRDPSTRPALLSVLRDEAVQVPVLGVGAGGTPGRQRAEVQFLPVVVHGRPAIAAYTSAARLAEHVRDAGVDDVPALVLRGAELAAVVPAGHGLVVNPGSLLGAGLTATEVRDLAGGQPVRGGNR